MRTALTALTLIFLFGACDVAGPGGTTLVQVGTETDASIPTLPGEDTFQENGDVTDVPEESDSTKQDVDPFEGSRSAVPLQTFSGLEIRLIWPCPENGGHGYNPLLSVAHGDPGDHDVDGENLFHEDFLALNTPLREAHYKGTEMYDSYEHGWDACQPGTADNTKIAWLPVVPTQPGAFFGMMLANYATVREQPVTPQIKFQPDIEVALEVWCKGTLVWDMVWNPSELGISTPGEATALDLFYLETMTGDCDVTPYDPPIVWLPYGRN